MPVGGVPQGYNARAAGGQSCFDKVSIFYECFFI